MDQMLLNWFDEVPAAPRPPHVAPAPVAPTLPASLPQMPAAAPQMPVGGSRFTLGGFDLTKPLKNGQTLFRHQQEDVVRLIQRSTLLASEMGTGKTRSALMAAKVIYEQSGIVTVVLCPAKLVINWREEAAMVGHDAINVYSMSKPPSEKVLQYHDYLLIGDESHSFQNIDSRRTQEFLRIAECAEMVYALSGTPMNNAQPKNIFPLLKAIGHPLAKNRRQFEEEFCGAKRVKMPYKKPKLSCQQCKGGGRIWKLGLNGQQQREACPCRMVSIWDNSGSSNIEKLNASLKPYMIRRFKADCLDLPPKTRVLRDVEVSDTMQATYDKALKEAKARYQDKVRTGEIKAWKDGDGNYHTDGAAVALATFIRQAASLAKIEATTELAEEIIAQGSRVVIFTEFVEPAQKLAQHFGVRPYIGGLTQKDADAIVKRFQAGNAPAFVGTGQAGGLGLTLTAANYVILHDRPFVPGDAVQREDRCHRLGSCWPVTAIWVRAFDVCRAIDSLLETKTEIITRALGGANKGPVTASQVLRSLFGK